MARELAPTDPPDELEREEISAIIQHFGGTENRATIYELIDAQLTVIHGRAQSLMQVAGVVVTVTGFSGRIIADTSPAAQNLIVSGLTLVAIAAAIALLFVMPIRWMTCYLHLPIEEWILVGIRRRRKKSRAIRISSAILVVGMILYVAAIAMMLLHPEAAELKKVR